MKTINRARSAIDQFANSKVLHIFPSSSSRCNSRMGQ